MCAVSPEDNAAVGLKDEAASLVFYMGSHTSHRFAYTLQVKHVLILSFSNSRCVLSCE
jgi:hypothetical protein